jgi:hypothetical protein
VIAIEARQVKGVLQILDHIAGGFHRKPEPQAQFRRYVRRIRPDRLARSVGITQGYRPRTRPVLKQIEREPQLPLQFLTGE